MKYVIDSGHGGILFGHYLTPGPIQIPLAARVKEVNRLQKVEPDIVLVSIHANAAGSSGWSSASGSRVFIRENAEFKSKSLAEHIERVAREIMIGIPYPIRPIKEKNFKILKVNCPGVLIECGFMTNKDDAAFMASLEGPSTIADWISTGIESFEKSLEV